MYVKYLFTFCLILILTSLFITCNSHSESPTSCMENPDAEGKLIVIVGEKIDITEVENPVEGFHIQNILLIIRYCKKYVAIMRNRT